MTKRLKSESRAVAKAGTPGTGILGARTSVDVIVHDLHNTLAALQLRVQVMRLTSITNQVEDHLAAIERLSENARVIASRLSDECRPKPIGA